jgi:hypothetical protein
MSSPFYNTERFEDFQENDRLRKQADRADLWTSLPVVIGEHQAAQNTVTIDPALKLAYVNDKGSIEWQQIPTIKSSPLLYLGGGGMHITIPVQKGDEGLAIFASRGIDAWWANGGVQNQDQNRTHHLTDAFVIPGFHSQPNKLSNVDQTSMQMRTTDGKTSFGFNPTSGGSMTMTAPNNPTTMNGKGFNTNVTSQTHNVPNGVQYNTPSLKSTGYIDAKGGFFVNGVPIGTGGGGGGGGGAGGGTIISPAPPVNPQPATLWWDPIGGQLYIWYDDGDTQQWVAATNMPGPPGPPGTPGGGTITGVNVSTGLTGGGLTGIVTIGLVIPVAISSGGTGATAPVGALANLGGLPLSGGTMSGFLTLASAPQLDLHAVTKIYVDTAVSLLAPIASPHFSGVPTAPTPGFGDSSITIATTAFVQSQGFITGGPYALLASPAFTGNPTSPTPTAGDNDTSIATTAFVTLAISNAPNKTITLAGDVVGSGTSTINTVLSSTVNPNIGTFQGITVNGKGLVTAAVNQNYLTTAAASTIYAPIASPLFTGNPQAPTPATADSSISIATTAWVRAQGFTGGTGTYLPLGGGILTGTLTINRNAINPTLPPTDTVFWVTQVDGIVNRFLMDAYGTGAVPNITFRFARGTAAASTAAQNGDPLGIVAAFGYGATGYSSGGRAQVRFGAIENWTDTAQGTSVQFLTTTAGTTTILARAQVNRGLMVLDASGNPPTGGTAGDMGSGTINVASGFYVNGVNIGVGSFLPLTGGTLTGPLTVGTINGTMTVGTTTAPVQMGAGAILATALTTTGGSALFGNIYMDAANASHLLAAAPATALNNGSGEFSFYTAPSAAVGSAPAWTRILYITSAGNLSVTGTVTAPTFVGALTGHASSDLALTGGTLTGNLNTVGQTNNGWFYTGINSPAYPTSFGGCATSWNFNVGQGDVDFWNCYTFCSGYNSFYWYQLTTAGSAATKVMSVGPSGLNVGGAYIQNNGTFLSTSTAGGFGQYHMTAANNANQYGSMWYNDGTNTYLLLTNNNDAMGIYNQLRPWMVTNATGVVSMNQGVIVNGGSINLQNGSASNTFITYNGSNYVQMFDDGNGHIECNTPLWLNANTNNDVYTGGNLHVAHQIYMPLDNWLWMGGYASLLQSSDSNFYIGDGAARPTRLRGTTVSIDSPNIYFNGYTHVQPGTSDNARITVPNGCHARWFYEVVNTRLWSAGCINNGYWYLADESAGIVRLTIDTAGTATFSNGIYTGAGIVLPNQNWLYGKDTAGASQVLCSIWSDNHAYFCDGSRPSHLRGSTVSIEGTTTCTGGVTFNVRSSFNDGFNIYGGTFYNGYNNGWLYFNGSLRVANFYSEADLNCGGSVYCNSLRFYNNSGWWWTPSGIHSDSTIQGSAFQVPYGGYWYGDSDGSIRTGTYIYVGGILPLSDNAMACGYSGQGWSQVGSYWFNQLSARHLKDDITPLPSGALDRVMALRPVTYRWKTGETRKVHSGFIADEVASVLGEDWGGYNKENGTEGLAYNELTAVLWKACQEMAESNRELASRVARLEQSHGA